VVGYGRDASDTGVIMLPLALSTLIVGPVSGLIILKLYSARGLILGSGVISIAFLLITLFYLDEVLFSVFAALLNIGYLFVTVSAINMIILSTPKHLIGTSLGVSTLLKFIGGGIGPAIAAMYMHTHLTYTLTTTTTATTTGNSGTGLADFIPSTESYLAIFFYSTVISLIGIVVATMLALKSPKCQHHSVEERGEMGLISQMIIEEITNWDLVEVRPHPWWYGY